MVINADSIYYFCRESKKMINDSGYNTAEMNSGITDTNNSMKVCEDTFTALNNHLHDLNSIKEDNDDKGYNYFATHCNSRSTTFDDHLQTSMIKTEPFVNCSDEYSTPECQPTTFEKIANKKPPKDLKFHCTHCIKTFAKKQQLENHTKTHTKEKNFQCETCQKSFIHKQQLTNHEKTHTGNKDFSCTYCYKCFALKQQLQIHEKIHTNEKNFACNMCEKSFITKQQLQNHVNSHLGIKPFTCNECHKKFAHKQQLERHIKNHTLKQNYTCEESNAKFLTKTLHNEHLKDMLHMEQSHNKIQLHTETFDELPS